MDKFILAENPMRPEQSGQFIIHMLDPVAIVQAVPDHLEYPSGKFYKHFSFQNIDKVQEDWTLSIHFMFTKELDNEQHHSIVNHMLDRAWRWYRSYLEWEDKQHENET